MAALLKPRFVFVEVGGPDRFVQKLFVEKKDFSVDFEFAPMAAAEYEHGMPQHEFLKFVKSKLVFTATEIWANGYCADVYLWHPQRLDLAKYKQDLKLMATGVLAKHRDPGIQDAIKAQAGRQRPQRWHGHAWFDITGGVVIATDAEQVATVSRILREKAQAK